MIIDIHTHAFPDAIAQAAVSKLQAGSHTFAFSDGTYGALSAGMKASGIDMSVVLPVATGARQVEHINDFAIRVNERTAETGVMSFGCMHPGFEDPAPELERIARAGVRGIKLHPAYQQVDFDDERYLRILDICAALGLVVITHAGYDVGLPLCAQASAEKLARAAQKAKGVTLVLAHMGAWRDWQRACELLPETGAYIDTSFSLGSMTPCGDGYYKTPQELERLSEEEFLGIVRAFGYERVLFGSDSPWGDAGADARRIAALPLSETETAAILGGNAQKLLGIK